MLIPVHVYKFEFEFIYSSTHKVLRPIMHKIIFLIHTIMHKIIFLIHSHRLIVTSEQEGRKEKGKSIIN